MNGISKEMHFGFLFFRKKWFLSHACGHTHSHAHSFAYAINIGWCNECLTCIEMKISQNKFNTRMS